MSRNLFKCAGNSQRCCTAKGYGTGTAGFSFHILFLTHVGKLVTAVNAGKYVTAGNGYFSVSINGTGIMMPLASRVWIVTGTAAKHISVESVTVIANCTATL